MRNPEAHRTSLILDTTLIREASRVLGTRSATSTVQRALHEVVAREKRQILAGWQLADLNLDDLERLRQSQAPA